VVAEPLYQSAPQVLTRSSRVGLAKRADQLLDEGHVAGAETLHWILNDPGRFFSRREPFSGTGVRTIGPDGRIARSCQAGSLKAPHSVIPARGFPFCGSPFTWR